MKFNWKKIFSFIATDSTYFNDSQDKIEFSGCKMTGKGCLTSLTKINDHYRESDYFYRDRDYNRAIDALDKAWSEAGGIKDPNCQRCSIFFQATVIQSLESIHSELEKSTKGFFATNRYVGSYKKADELLNKLKATNTQKPTYSYRTVHSTLQPAYSL